MNGTFVNARRPTSGRIRHFCHMCRGQVDIGEVAHVDLYSDLCWVQCNTCAAAHGDVCGVDRHWNPTPHGYVHCPFRMVTAPPGHVAIVHGISPFEVGDVETPRGEGG